MQLLRDQDYVSFFIELSSLPHNFRHFCMKQHLHSDPSNDVTVWIYINLNHMMSQPLLLHGLCMKKIRPYEVQKEGEEMNIASTASRIKRLMWRD